MKKVLSDRKNIFGIVSVVALVAYAVVAFAAAPSGGYLAGATLEPQCGPGTTDCKVNIGSATGVTYGGAVTSGHNNELLFVDGSGNLASDAGFTRDATTGVTNTSAVFGSGTASYQLSNNFFGFGLTGAMQSYITPAGMNIVLNTDFSGVGGANNATLIGFSNLGSLAANSAYTYDSNTGLGSIENDVHDGGGRIKTSLDTTAGFNVKDGNSNSLFAVSPTGAVKINNAYTLPTIDGTAGYVLATNGSGVVSWQSGGGGFTIDGSNNMFGGTNAGGSLTTGTSNFFAGIDAGASVTEGLKNTLVGRLTGDSITTGNNNSFFGTAAGGDNVSGSGNVFIGNDAGSKSLSDNNVYIGAGSATSVTSGAQNVFLGSKAGSSGSLTTGINNILIGYLAGGAIGQGNVSDAILIGASTSSGGFDNAVAIGSGAINTAANQFYLADSITNFNLAGVNYNFPTAQAAGSGYVLTNDGSGNLTWAAPSGGGSGITYGGNVTAGHDSQVLYLDAFGNLASDSSFTREINTGFTHISAPVKQSPLSPAALDISDDLFGFSQFGASIHGIAQSFITANGKNIVATGDFSQAGGTADETILGFTDFAGTSALGTFNYDVGNGSAIRFETQDGGGDVFTTLAPGGGFTINGKDQLGSSKSFTVKDSANNKLFQVFNDGTVAINSAYSLPTTDGTSGYLLSTNGSGVLGWTAPVVGFTIDSASKPNMYAGTGAGGSLTIGNGNFFAGLSSGSLTTSGNFNTFTGYHSGISNDSGSNNSFFGYEAGGSNVDGSDNVSIGSGAGFYNVSGVGNVAIGLSAGSKNTVGSNVYIGSGSGASATTGTENTYLGYHSGTLTVTGGSNVFLGSNAGSALTQGDVSNSILIGQGTSSEGFSNSIAMGTGAANTKANQFMLADSITDVKWRGVEYSLPSAQAVASGYVLRNDGSGGLSWQPDAVATASPIVIGTSGTSLYTPSLGASEGDVSTGFNIILGSTAGSGATSVQHSNFLGTSAGVGATGASFSNFFGSSAGANASNADSSNFFGENAGAGATGAFFSNFFGSSAGSGASNAPFSNFLGDSSGIGATNASYSNFIGSAAGSGATNATTSNFLGLDAGYGAVNAASSIFIGNAAGYHSNVADTVDNVTVPGWSILIGNNTGTGGFSNSIALGANAVNTATNQFYVADTITNFNLAGVNYNFPVSQAAANGYLLANDGSGNLTWTAPNPVLVGSTSSFGQNEVFLGLNAGGNGAVKTSTVFIGQGAGDTATAATGSVFIGQNTGALATSSANSVFLGGGAGYSAGQASNSVFIGSVAGNNASTATNAIFIGYGAGQNDTVDNTIGGASIVIGQNASTGGFSNSIALGTSAVNTATNQFSVGSSTSPIDQFVMVGSSGTSCALDANGTSCSSDQRLKTNITDLSAGTLDTLTKVRTITFNWISGVDGNQHIGFLAQDLQQYFPQLVSTAPNGYLQVNYAGMAPILTESIRELNLKFENIDAQASKLVASETFLGALRAWLADAGNGISSLSAGTLHTADVQTDQTHTNQLCVGTVCVTQDQFLHMVQQSGTVSSSGNSQPSVVVPSSGSVTSTGGDTPASVPAGPTESTGSSDSSAPVTPNPVSGGSTPDASAAPAASVADPVPAADPAPVVSAPAAAPDAAPAPAPAADGATQ